MSITRIQIAEHVGMAFDPDSPGEPIRRVSKHDLLSHAVATHAAPPLLEALHELPDQPYRSLRDLWPHLPEVPRA